MIPSTGVVIPSAGQGTRMRSGPAKQLLIIGGATILGHTVRRILELPGVRHLVIPTSPDLVEETWKIVNGCLDQQGNTQLLTVDVIIGGKERMDSVHKGLMYLEKTDAELLLIHDAVRPCFPLDAASQALRTAHAEGAAILAIPSRDTVKVVDSQRRIVGTPDRKTVWFAQTPQVFRKELLLDAYVKAEKAELVATDDASLVEFAGYTVHIIPGSHENIKITYQSDLLFAELWLSIHTDKD